MLGPTAIELLYDTQTGLIYFCFVWLKVPEGELFHQERSGPTELSNSKV